MSQRDQAIEIDWTVSLHKTPIEELGSQRTQVAGASKCHDNVFDGPLNLV